MSADPYWNHVALAMHCDTEPATEVKGKTVIATGTAASITEDSSQTLFGQHTLHFVGEANDAGGLSGSTLRIATLSDWDLGGGDFTIEGWALFDTGLPMSTTVDTFIPYPLMERSNGTFSAGCWSLHDAVYRRLIGSSYARRPQFQFWHADYSTTAAMLDAGQGVSADSEGVWRHFAVTRQGNQWTFWIQGVLVDAVNSTVVTGIPSAHLRVGNSIFNTDSLGLDATTPPLQGRAFSGNLAECRITKGLARYTVAFEDAFTDGVGPGARFPDELATGDYTDQGLAGPQGAAATGDRIDGLPGPDGEGRSSGVSVILPPPPSTYNQQNEADTRRTIESAALRASRE